MERKTALKVRLGELLVEQGVISSQQLARALEHQKRHPGYRKLGETLLALQLVTEEAMLKALARALRITAIDLRKVDRVDPDALKTLSVDTAEKELVLPLRFVQQGSSRKLHLAMADPTNLQAIDDLQFRLGCSVEPSLTTISQVRDAIRRFYRGATLELEGLIDLEPIEVAETAELISGGNVKTLVGDGPRRRSVRVVELTFFSGSAKGRSVQIPIGSDVVIGRGHDVDVVVDDERMSRRHFEIRAKEDEVVLVDLESSNGTFHNKKSVRRVALADGDWVQAGDTLLKVGLVTVTG